MPIRRKKIQIPRLPHSYRDFKILAFFVGLAVILAGVVFSIVLVSFIIWFFPSLADNIAVQSFVAIIILGASVIYVIVLLKLGFKEYHDNKREYEEWVEKEKQAKLRMLDQPEEVTRVSQLFERIEYIQDLVEQWKRNWDKWSSQREFTFITAFFLGIGLITAIFYFIQPLNKQSQNIIVFGEIFLVLIYLFLIFGGLFLDFISKFPPFSTWFDDWKELNPLVEALWLGHPLALKETLKAYEKDYHEEVASWYLYFKAWTQIIDGLLPEAIQSLEQLLTAAKSYDRPLVCETKFLLGKCYVLQQRNKEANRYLREAIDCFSKLNFKNPIPLIEEWLISLDETL